MGPIIFYSLLRTIRKYRFPFSVIRNVVKAYYTAGIVYDVLQTFGELSEESVHNRKYAKYKAAYIHNCLKNGETPIPGPHNDENSGEGDDNDDVVVRGGGAPPANSNTEPTPPPPAQSSTSDEPSEPEPHSPIEFKPHPTEINGMSIVRSALCAVD